MARGGARRDQSRPSHVHRPTLSTAVWHFQASTSSSSDLQGSLGLPLPPEITCLSSAIDSPQPTLSHSPSPSLGDSLPTTPLFAVGSPFLKPLLYPPRHGRKKNHRRSNVRKFRIVHSLHYHEHGSNFKVIPKPTSPRSYFFDVRGRYPFSRHPACLVALHLVSPVPAISLV